MLSVEQARQKIAQAATPTLSHEVLALTNAYSRIVAVDCIATINVPPADNSAMDGYAVFAPMSSTELPISQTISAGTTPKPLAKGTAARILTGANIPENANAVVIQENCSLTHSGNIQIQSTAHQGDNIRPAGQDIAIGDIIVKKGTVLRAPELGVLASCGVSEVSVFCSPKIALINTGSELIAPGAPLKPGQIYNSNEYMLSALLQEWGCTIVHRIQVIDDLEATKKTLKCISNEVDFIVTSGGVSVGDEDHIKPAVESLGELNFWKIFLKPGKPLAFGSIFTDDQSTPIMGLPGNPVSAFVTAVLFAKAFIEGSYGRAYKPIPALYIPANFSVTKQKKRPEYMRVLCDNSVLTPLANQSSGVLSSVQKADGLALVPEDTIINLGDNLAYYPMQALTQLG